MKKNIIIVRGGGDIATGTIYKLHQSGYPVLVTEIANPSAIRRQVAFSEAVYEKSYTVEGVTCYFAENLTQALNYVYNYSYDRIVNTAEHELGHAIGLDHTDGESVMQPAGSFYSIQDTDVEAVRQLYKEE